MEPGDRFDDGKAYRTPQGGAGYRASGASRSSQATNSKTGNSNQGSTTYDKETGVSRTASCTNPAGETIACPRQ